MQKNKPRDHQKNIIRKEDQRGYCGWYVLKIYCILVGKDHNETIIMYN